MSDREIEEKEKQSLLDKITKLEADKAGLVEALKEYQHVPLFSPGKDDFIEMTNKTYVAREALKKFNTKEDL